jgi:hypothetical protein
MAAIEDTKSGDGLSEPGAPRGGERREQSPSQIGSQFPLTANNSVPMTRVVAASPPITSARPSQSQPASPLPPPTPTSAKADAKLSLNDFASGAVPGKAVVGVGKPDTADRVPPAVRSMKDIVEEEAHRRRVLFEAALAMFRPVIECLRSACDQGSKASLDLAPPDTRDSRSARGVLYCRSFHHGVGETAETYSIVISPERGCCELTLPSLMSDEEQDEFYELNGDWPDPEWTATYWTGLPSRGADILQLRDKIEEALITELAELRGGLDRFKLADLSRR